MEGVKPPALRSELECSTPIRAKYRLCPCYCRGSNQYHDCQTRSRRVAFWLRGYSKLLIAKTSSGRGVRLRRSKISVICACRQGGPMASKNTVVRRKVDDGGRAGYGQLYNTHSACASEARMCRVRNAESSSIASRRLNGIARRYSRSIERVGTPPSVCCSQFAISTTDVVILKVGVGLDAINTLSMPMSWPQPALRRRSGQSKRYCREKAGVIAARKIGTVAESRNAFNTADVQQKKH